MTTATEDEARRQRREKRKRLNALYEKDVNGWTDAEIIEVLTAQYAPPVIPPCHICGRELSPQAMGGGEPTVYACSGRENGEFLQGRSLVDKHYSDSEYKDYRRGGDEAVIELIRRFQQRSA